MRLLGLMKQAGIEAVNTTNPMSYIVGTVTSVDPLVITVDQKTPIPSNFLYLTDNVRDYEVEVDVNTGIKKYTVKKGLKLGEKVQMLRIQGGQKLIVINRVVES